MKPYILILFIVLCCLGFSTQLYAVNVLQVGAPGPPGSYADYIASSIDPTETDTAITSGNTIYFAGVYQNQNVLNLGKQYDGGNDWSALDPAFIGKGFDGKGAIVVASVPDGQGGSLTIDIGSGAMLPFFSSSTLSGLFPNNHDPLKDGISDFLFFDIGDFAKNLGVVPDFSSESGSADGEIKTATIAVSGYDWVHFDLIAIETSTQGKTDIITTWKNNPGSHDVTWKGDDTEVPQGTPVPEPATMMLMGIGLIGIGLSIRKKIK